MTDFNKQNFIALPAAKIPATDAMTDLLLESEMDIHGLVREKNGNTLICYDLYTPGQFPFIYTDRDGKSYKISIDYAEFLFGA